MTPLGSSRTAGCCGPGGRRRDGGIFRNRPPALDRIGANAAMLAVAAGVLGWTVSAETAVLPALAQSSATC
jgi:hypothetical protein